MWKKVKQFLDNIIMNIMILCDFSSKVFLFILEIISWPSKYNGY